MKKIKAIAFALLYLAIPIAVQIILSAIISFQVIVIRLLHGAQISSQALQDAASSYQVNIILVMIVDVILIVGMGLWYFFLRKENQPVNQPERYGKLFQKNRIGLLVILAFASQFVCNLVMMGFQVLFPEIYKDYTELAEGLSLDVLPVWCMLLIVGVIGPIAEEIVFRGMIFRTLRKGFSFGLAAILSGVFFGIYHMNWVQGVYASCLGILLAFVYERTQTIWGAILFHMFFNISSYVLESMAKALPEGIVGLIYLIGMAVALVSFIPLLRKLSKMFPTKKLQHQQVEDTWMNQEEQQNEEF